jgi:hypothetical protein
MTKTKLELIARALTNGSTVRTDRAREMKALDDLIAGHFLASEKAAPGVIAYTVTNHGRAAYESFKRAAA